MVVKIKRMKIGIYFFCLESGGKIINTAKFLENVNLSAAQKCANGCFIGVLSKFNQEEFARDIPLSWVFI